MCSLFCKKIFIKYLLNNVKQFFCFFSNLKKKFIWLIETLCNLLQRIFNHTNYSYNLPKTCNCQATFFRGHQAWF
jgi:hypothetical protein